VVGASPEGSEILDLDTNGRTRAHSVVLLAVNRVARIEVNLWDQSHWGNVAWMEGLAITCLGKCKRGGPPSKKAPGHVQKGAK